VGDEISFTKIWRTCVLKVLYLVDLYNVMFHLWRNGRRFCCRCHWGWGWIQLVCGVVSAVSSGGLVFTLVCLGVRMDPGIIVYLWLTTRRRLTLKLQITSLSPVYSDSSQTPDWRVFGVPTLPYCVGLQINNSFERPEALTANKCIQTFSIDRPRRS